VKRPAPRPEDEAARARRLALGWLGRRDHGREEMRRRLARRGFGARIVAELVEDFDARGWLDDGRFAENYARSRARRGYGPLRIRAELEGLGVAPDLVEVALEGIGADWAERAEQVRCKRFGAGLPAAWPERARQARFLEYRGFGSEHFRGLMNGRTAGDED